MDMDTIKATARKVVGGLIVLVLLTIMNLFAGAMVLGALLIGQFSYAGRVLRAMDCLGAAQIGYDGRNTISKECGRQHPRGTFCRRICRWLDWADEGHCNREGGIEQ